MSPTRAEAGCAGVPLPPSTPSSASRQQQASGQQFVNASFCQGWNPGFVGNAGGCVSQQSQGSQGFVLVFWEACRLVLAMSWGLNPRFVKFRFSRCEFSLVMVLREC